MFYRIILPEVTKLDLEAFHGMDYNSNERLFFFCAHYMKEKVDENEKKYKLSVL
jgi:hypothetical protein